MAVLLTFLILAVELYVIYVIIKFVSNMKTKSQGFVSNYRERFEEVMKKAQESNNQYSSQSYNQSKGLEKIERKSIDQKNTTSGNYQRTNQGSESVNNDYSVVGDIGSELDDMAKKYFRKKK